MRAFIKRHVWALSILTGLVGEAGQATAAFEDMPVSPQAAALGGAALSGENDSTSLFLNPAMLGMMTVGDAYFMYDQLYAGMQGTGSIGQGLLSAAVPTRFGVIGAGVGTLSAQGLENEREIELAYAHKLGALSLGVTGKQLYQSYSIGNDPAAAADPVFANGTARSAFSFDAGLVYDAGDPLTLGLAVRNINSPNVGLASVDAVSREIQASMAYAWPVPGLRAMADLLYTAQPSGTLQDRLVPSLGLEKAFYDGRAALRLGVTSLGLSAGVGLRLGSFGFDYAVILERNLVGGSFGTQMLGVRYRFGGAAALPAPLAPVRPISNPSLSVPYEPL